MFFDQGHAQEFREFLDTKRSEGAPWVEEVHWVDESDSDKASLCQYVPLSTNMGLTDSVKITGIKDCKGAISVPAVSFWPYKFVTALLSIVVELGGQLYTETCVESVEENNLGHTALKTPRGILKAKKTIFATNAYTASLLPQYESVITPVKGQNSHISAAQCVVQSKPLLNTYNLHFSSRYADYLVPRPDGSSILGGAKWTFDDDVNAWWNTVDDATLINDTATQHFDSVMADHFHGWHDAEAHHDMVWSGSEYFK